MILYCTVLVVVLWFEEEEEKETQKLLPANKVGHFCQFRQSCSHFHKL